MLDELSTEIWFSIIAGSLLLFLLCTFIVAFTMLYIKRRRQHNMEKQQLETQFEQTLLQSELEIKEQTLQYVASELHDNLGQVASLIKIHLNTFQFKDEAKARQKIEDTKELIRQLITDLKLLSVRLGSDKVAQSGILKGLENEVERLNKTGLYKTTLQKDGAIPPLDDNTTIILYRMVQEVINNIIKHSRAKRIDINLKVEGIFFTLSLKDDGVGFNMEEKIKNGGSGLKNLYNRAKLINAKLLISSSPGKGTKILIELPL